MADELSKADRTRLQAQLTALRAELEGLLASTAEDADPVDLNLPIGRLSRMDAIQQQMSAATRSGYERRLAQVNRALAGCDAGEYGDCKSCGDPIGVKRLTAKPEAPFCIGCQEEMEG